MTSKETTFHSKYQREMNTSKAKVDVVLGLQWGDEGKGKIVDVLADNYNVIARFQGGPNAGHSLKFGETSHVLHSIPSGIFREGTVNIIGNGVVLDPIIFKEENGITFEVPNSNVVIVHGIDKQAVGQIAAQIREKRPPEPYLGKGVKYSGEKIRRKAGKTGK